MFYKFPFNKANLNLGFMLHVGTMQSETWAEIHANCFTPAPRHCLFFIVKYAQAQHQWAQRKAAPAVRPADIRGLVIRIGTYTHTHTHAIKGPVCVCTRGCADVFAQSIFAQTSAHKRGHIKDENEPIKSRILEAAVRNDQGVTSITVLLSHHRRQLHLNWTCNSLLVPKVDVLWALVPFTKPNTRCDESRERNTYKSRVSLKGAEWIAAN